MNNLITLDESISVARSLNEVFAYISDFPRIAEWDPAVAKGLRLTDGALGVGSQFQIDMKAGFSLRYTVTEWEPECRMLMTVEAKIFTAIEEIRFTATTAGTQVRYIAQFSFPAPLARLSKMFPGVMDKVGKRAMAGMQQALEDRFETPRATRATVLADALVIPGMLRFTRFGYQGARKRWKPVSAYLAKRHIVITGATSGLGLATAKVLASRGAELTLVARDETKVNSLAKDLQQGFGNPRIHVELADLSLMADVNALAERLLKAGRDIDALVNNAGALIDPREETSEGLEKSFALLLLSPCLLTERLHPLLKKAAKTHGPARVINVLSGGMYSQKIHAHDLESAQGEYAGSLAYARAKRGLMILTEQWAADWGTDGIVVNAMHPGWADTPGLISALPEFRRVIKWVLRSPAEGADTIIWLATATESGKVSGQFWLDRQPHSTHMLPSTRESADERQIFLDAMADYMRLYSTSHQGRHNHLQWQNIC